MKNVLADGSWTQRGGGLWVPPGRAGTAARLCRSGVPCCTLQPPTFPMPGRAWGKCVVCGCRRASTTARGCRSVVMGGGQALVPWRTLLANANTDCAQFSSLYILFSILSSIILWVYCTQCTVLYVRLLFTYI